MKVVLNGKHREEASVLALGMFDGMHIGHQVLLERARTLHMRWGAPLVVCTFARHPMELIAPERAPRLLTTLEERISLISHAGADVFSVGQFDPAAVGPAQQRPGPGNVALSQLLPDGGRADLLPVQGDGRHHADLEAQRRSQCLQQRR